MYKIKIFEKLSKLKIFGIIFLVDIFNIDSASFEFYEELLSLVYMALQAWRLNECNHDKFPLNVN